MTQWPFLVFLLAPRRVTNRNWTLPKITHGCCWSGGDLGGLVRNICYILLLHISDLNVMASPTSTERYCLGWVCWARMRRVKRKMTPTPLEKIKIYTLYIYSHYIPLLLNICIIYPIISLVVKNGDNFCEALRVPNCMLTLGQFSALPNARHQVSPNHLVSKDVGLRNAQIYTDGQVCFCVSPHVISHPKWPATETFHAVQTQQIRELYSCSL